MLSVRLYSSARLSLASIILPATPIHNPFCYYELTGGRASQFTSARSSLGSQTDFSPYPSVYFDGLLETSYCVVMVELPLPYYLDSTVTTYLRDDLS